MFWVLLIQREAQREMIHKRLVEGFHAWELMLIEITDEVKNDPAKPYREIHSREFEYLGQMYDIVEKQEFESTTWYLAYPDKKETALKSKLKKIIQNVQKNADKPLLENLLSENGSWLCPRLATINFLAYEPVMPDFFPGYSFSVIELFANPPGPPPKA